MIYQGSSTCLPTVLTQTEEIAIRRPKPTFERRSERTFPIGVVSPMMPTKATWFAK